MTHLPSTDHTFDPVELPSHYAKAIVAIATAALAVVLTALADATITGAEWAGIALAILSAVGVYLVPNLTAGIGAWLKLGVAVLGTALQAAIPLLAEGTITQTGWVLIALAALSAVGVGIIPNSPAAPAPAQRGTPVG